MAYVKPGVEITQKQETVSPTLINPDLFAVVLGPAYRVVDIPEGRDTAFTHDYGVILSTGVTTIDLYSGVSFETAGLLDVDDKSIYVDIVGTQVSVLGQTLHVPAEHTSLALNVDGHTLTINTTALSGISNVATTYWVSGHVSVGWRAVDGAIVGQALQVSSATEIEGLAGKRTPENPLGFGLGMAMANANTAIYAIGMSGITDNDHADALGIASSLECYALAPMDLLTTSQASTYATHATTRSEPTEKMERIVFGTIEQTLTGVPATDAAAIASQSAAFANKRFFSVIPHQAYYETRVHISQANPNYIENVLGLSGAFAILNQKITTTYTKLSGRTLSATYYRGQEITETIWQNIASTTSFINVLLPVPGYYWSAAVAGQVAGYPPQQGHTNLPLAGSLSKVKYSSDYYTQTDLNTIAAGGTYIIHQSSPSAIPTCRHQLSTDMSSIETRELNITTVVDYVSKYLRNALTPYIGRYNITPQFLNLMSMTIDGLKNKLIREGIIQNLIVEELAQSTTERDTLLVTISLGLSYPLNYIKITLAF